jgi:branched-chain amino acid transport system permease protein
MWGALLGGIALGVAQLIGLKLDPNSGSLYSHILFLFILLVKPTGIAGARK